jgi:hypothetical protein
VAAAGLPFPAGSSPMLAAPVSFAPPGSPGRIPRAAPPRGRGRVPGRGALQKSPKPPLPPSAAPRVGVGVVRSPAQKRRSLSGSESDYGGSDRDGGRGLPLPLRRPDPEPRVLHHKTAAGRDSGAGRGPEAGRGPVAGRGPGSNCSSRSRRQLAAAFNSVGALSPFDSTCVSLLSPSPVSSRPVSPAGPDGHL